MKRDKGMRSISLKIVEHEEWWRFIVFDIRKATFHFQWEPDRTEIDKSDHQRFVYSLSFELVDTLLTISF